MKTIKIIKRLFDEATFNPTQKNIRRFLEAILDVPPTNQSIILKNFFVFGQARKKKEFIKNLNKVVKKEYKIVARQF